MIHAQWMYSNKDSPIRSICSTAPNRVRRTLTVLTYGRMPVRCKFSTSFFLSLKAKEVASSYSVKWRACWTFWRITCDTCSTNTAASTVIQKGNDETRRSMSSMKMDPASFVSYSARVPVDSGSTWPRPISSVSSFFNTQCIDIVILNLNFILYSVLKYCTTRIGILVSSRPGLFGNENLLWFFPTLFSFSFSEVDLQAMDRAHRIGAKKPVQVRNTFVE